MIALRRAEAADAEILTELSRRAFDADVAYGAPGPGGPPGYDDVEWQRRAISAIDYYAIAVDEEPIGGLFLYSPAPGVYELVRIFLAPEWQNQGLGGQTLALLWPLYPEAAIWRLDTPAWNARTRHFYAREGFCETGINSEGGVLFERQMAGGEQA